MKRIKVRCPYCGSLASKRPARDVYGDKASANKYLYICDCYPRCDSYVAANEKQARQLAESVIAERIYDEGTSLYMAAV